MRKTIVVRQSRRAPSWRVVTLLGAAGLGAVNSSCSLVFIDGPPAEHAKMAYFDCTSTYGLPVADGLFALTGALGAGVALGQSKQAYADKNSGASRNAAAGVDLAFAGLGAASAVYGIVQTARCDSAKEDLKSRILAPALHRPQPPPPFPESAPPPPPPPPLAPALPPPVSPPHPPGIEDRTP
jgi:hypothetical protein